MAGQKFGNVSSVALTPGGHLLVFNRNPVVMMSEFDAAGKLVRTFNPNIAVNAHGLRVDRHGDIWALDSFLNVIWKLDSSGGPLLMLGTRGEVGEWREGQWNGMFNQPLDVAFDRDDNIYVVQSHGGTSAPPDCTYCATYKSAKPAVPQGSDPRLLKFDKRGNFLASRSLAHEDGNYPTIHTVIVTPRGEVWVGDRQANAILVFNEKLEPLRRIQEPNRVSGLFVDAKGALWMSSGMDGMVMTLAPDGKITGWIGKGGRTTDPDSYLIGEAHYVVITPDQKTIYIADSVNAKVVVLRHN
jgi:DNA-binding beta-propeller fold protein YncE